MKTRLIYLLLVGWLGWSLPALSQDQAQDQDSNTGSDQPTQNLSEEEYQAKLQELQSTIQELEEELSTVKGNRQDLINQLEDNETRVGELRQKIEEIQAELEAEEQALRDLKQERRQLVQEQRSQKKHIAQQVRAAYRLGGQSNLKLLLNQDDPQQVARILQYYDYFLEARTTKLAGYIETIDRLNQVEPQIRRKTASLERNQQSLKTRYEELKAAQSQREKTLARLDATIENKDQELQKLETDREAVERVLSKLDTLVTPDSPRPYARGDQPFASLQGELPWPAEGRISHGFGSDRIAGKMRWSGVVIDADEGAPVRAIHHGRVVFADYLRGHGLLIILDHGDGFMSLYGHNRTLSQRVGRWVEGGEVIARVGTSGGQRQAGLYFEIRQNGKPTDPKRWCG